MALAKWTARTAHANVNEHLCCTRGSSPNGMPKGGVFEEAEEKGAMRFIGAGKHLRSESTGGPVEIPRA